MHSDLIAQLAATPSTLAHLVAESTEAELDAAPDGEWNARTLLAHFRDDEYLCMRVALERMLAEETPTLRFIDGGEWEPGRSHARDRKDWLLADFALQRQASVAIFRALQPTDWERTGRTIENGLFTVATFLRAWVNHDAEHIAQLEAALGETLEQVRYRRARRDD